MVCATLSGVMEGIQTPISIALATSNSAPGTELISKGDISIALVIVWSLYSFSCC